MNQGAEIYSFRLKDAMLSKSACGQRKTAGETSGCAQAHPMRRTRRWAHDVEFLQFVVQLSCSDGRHDSEEEAQTGGHVVFTSLQRRTENATR
jgi:hypothetical protein